MDRKLDNFMLSEGIIKICDFGSVSYVSDSSDKIADELEGRPVSAKECHYKMGFLRRGTKFIDHPWLLREYKIFI